MSKLVTLPKGKFTSIGVGLGGLGNSSTAMRSIEHKDRPDICIS